MRGAGLTTVGETYLGKEMLPLLPLLGLVFLVVALLIARYGPNPQLRRGPREEPERTPISPSRLRDLVVELLEAMGLQVTEFEGDSRHLVATRPGPLHETRE